MTCDLANFKGDEIEELKSPGGEQNPILYSVVFWLSQAKLGSSISPNQEKYFNGC